MDDACVEIVSWGKRKLRNEFLCNMFCCTNVVNIQLSR